MAAATPTLAAVALILLLPLAAGASDYDSFIRQVTDGQASWPGLLPEAQFAAFVRRYGRRYSGPKEYARRLRVFAANLARAAAHQALDPSARHGITPFSDLTREEFEARFTGVRHAASGGRDAQRLVHWSVPAAAPATEEEVARLPASFDWRDRGAVTGVKTQGACGSCWAFSTTGAVEGANFLATGKLLDLSEQQLVDCDHKCSAAARNECDNGCGGGLMTNAYAYLMESGGLMEQRAYPYTGAAGPCRFDPSRVAVRVANFTAVPARDEAQIRAALVRRGPLAVGLNAAFMQTYVGGVSCPLICPRAWVNHGVLLVGYGARGFAALRLGYRAYWVIKNSWGEQWGENGYYRLCRGSNVCGVDTMVSAVAVAPPTVKKS
jgi:cathepsin F